MYKSIKEYIATVLWTVPFACFIVGYAFCYFLVHKSEIIVPSTLGKNIQEAAGILSSKNLGMRILAEREDALLPEGLVLDQIPKPGRTIRPNQHVFVLVSKRNSNKIAPDLCNKKIGEISEWARKNKIDLKIINVSSPHPKETCFAQSPNPGCKVSRKKVIVYISGGRKTFHIMPKLVGLQLDETKSLLKSVNAEVDVVKSNAPAAEDSNGKILDQKPMAGSIVDISKPLYVQVLI